MEDQQTLYQILGIETNAKLEEITDRYRILARELHPDVNPTQHDIALFIQIRRAYDVLRDKKKRQEYDRTIGIYHAKNSDSAFLKNSTNLILKEKLEEGDLIDDVVEFLPDRNAKKDVGVFSKIKSLMTGKPENIPNKDRVKKYEKVTKEVVEPKRIFQFSVNHLESVIGAERVLVLAEKDDEQVSIRVKIPKGINNNATLQIFHKSHGTIPIKIQFLPHPNIQRDKYDLTLLLPFTAEELNSNQYCEICTCLGTQRIEIKGKSTIKLAGHGIENKKLGEFGDFYVKIYDGGEKSTIDRISISKLLSPLHADS